VLFKDTLSTVEVNTALHFSMCCSWSTFSYVKGLVKEGNFKWPCLIHTSNSYYWYPHETITT